MCVYVCVCVWGGGGGGGGGGEELINYMIYPQDILIGPGSHVQ